MSPRPFRFAIQTAPFHDADALVERARLVESLSYDELWSSDHIGTAFGQNSADPFMGLVLAAQATTALRVGPLVINNEFYNPALLARTAISVDQMTGGRLVLGMGTGYAQVEHDAVGVPLLPPGPRVTRFGESLQILRQLCDEGACHFSSDHHAVAIDELGLRPVQPHIPFLVGGHGKRVVTLAGQHADIFQFTGLTHAKDGTPSGGGFAIDEVRLRADWLREAAGERNSEIERSVLVQRTAIGTAAVAEMRADPRLGQYESIIDDTPFMLLGSVEQVVDKLERLRADLGVSHFVVRDPEGFAPIVHALAGK